MNFLDKIKRGMSDAGAKAKIALEVNKLRQQIAVKQHEINQFYQRMGQHLFNQYEGQQLAIDEEILTYCADVLQRYHQIAELEVEIRALNGEKKCDCGEVVPLDVRFCPACGTEFPELLQPEVEGIDVEAKEIESETIEAIDAEVVEPIALTTGEEEEERVGSEDAGGYHCPTCHQAVPAEAKFCGSCGKILPR